MDATAHYYEHGYAGLTGFLPVDLCTGMFEQFMADLRGGAVKPKMNSSTRLLTRQAMELHGRNYAPMSSFHWGMTAAMAALTGADLVPTHCYFRIYNHGDICRPHNDREACEHSLSLMLASGGEAAWPLEVAREASRIGEHGVGEFAGDEDSYVSVPMQPGDAVLYQGITRRHGRKLPNPNPWSAHLFLHWVARDGAYAEEAFGTMALTRKRQDAKRAARAQGAESDAA